MSVRFVRPNTLEDAFAYLEDEEAHVFAGGQSLVILMNTGLFFAETLVSLGSIQGLRDVHEASGNLHLGALCTHNELADHELVRERIPTAVGMFKGIGNARVRNAGTLGGNIVHADPAQDPPVLLTALGAHIVVRSPGGGTRTVEVGDVSDSPFSTVLESNEIVTDIVVPIPPANAHTAYIKFLPGTQDDYATVSIGANVRLSPAGDVEDVHLTAGAIGATVLRLDEQARVLIGHKLDDEHAIQSVADAVRDVVSPYADRRGSSDYKRHLAGELTKRALRLCRP